MAGEGGGRTRTQASLRTELPLLLEERGLSLRALGAAVDVNESHLSRALRGVDRRKISGALAGEIAVSLGLPRDYFPEYRETVAIEALCQDPQLRDAFYDRLRKRGR